MGSWQAFGVALVLAAASPASADWAEWRGPTGDNHAPAGVAVPLEWSADRNVVWRAPVAGRGHSSPTVVGDRIYLTTSDKLAGQSSDDRGTQWLLIYDRNSGELLREVVAHRDGLPRSIHLANSHASSTVASDGERVFALFYNRGGVWITAYTLDGEQLWQGEVGVFRPEKYQFGFGSSPRLFDGKVIFASEFDGAAPGESGVFAVDAATGDPVWTAQRPSQLSYGTPAVATIDGRTQLLMSGNDLLGSYDAQTGATIWETPGSAMASCGTMVWDESLGLAFASGGYPKDYTLAIRLDGEHEIVWQNTTRCYEQSLLTVDGYVYGISNSGVANCWRGEDGKRMWRRRLGGGFSSSPLLVDGRVYVTNENGTTFVFEANPQRFVRLAENQLGDSAYATPSVVGDRMYHRYAATENGVRQEYLVAIGE